MLLVHIPSFLLFIRVHYSNGALLRQRRFILRRYLRHRYGSQNRRIGLSPALALDRSFFTFKSSHLFIHQMALILKSWQNVGSWFFIFVLFSFALRDSVFNDNAVLDDSGDIVCSFLWFRSATFSFCDHFFHALSLWRRFTLHLARNLFTLLTHNRAIIWSSLQAQALIPCTLLLLNHMYIILVVHAPILLSSLLGYCFCVQFILVLSRVMLAFVVSWGSIWTESFCVEHLDLVSGSGVSLVVVIFIVV